MMYTETKMARNGEMLHKRYALYDFGIGDLEKEIEWAQPVMVTDDPLEITAQVGGCESDDAKWCVEIFWADEEGEFCDSYAYDSITHFYEQHHVEEV